MLSEDVACWPTNAQPQLIGLGPAAAGACERVDKVLALFENTEVRSDGFWVHPATLAAASHVIWFLSECACCMIEKLAAQLSRDRQSFEKAREVTS